MEYGNRSAFLTHHRRRIAVLFGLLCLGMVGLTGRLVFLMMYRADHYSEMAQDLHQRERAIKAARGRILDANGTVIAANRTICVKTWGWRRPESGKKWKNEAPVRLYAPMWTRKPGTVSGNCIWPE